MKIDKVEALKVDVPLDKSFGGGTYNVDRRTAIITKIYTNEMWSQSPIMWSY